MQQCAPCQNQVTRGFKYRLDRPMFCRLTWLATKVFKWAFSAKTLQIPGNMNIQRGGGQKSWAFTTKGFI